MQIQTPLLTFLSLALISTANALPSPSNPSSLSSRNSKTPISGPQNALKPRIALPTDDSDTSDGSIIAVQQELAQRMAKREVQQEIAKRDAENQKQRRQRKRPKPAMPKGPGKSCLTVRGKIGKNGEDCVEMLSW